MTAMEVIQRIAREAQKMLYTKRPEFLSTLALIERVASGETPRRCSVCGKGMWEGYCLDGMLNGDYACSDKCLGEVYPGGVEAFKKDYKENEENEEENDNYWTEWEEGDLEEKEV